MTEQDQIKALAELDGFKYVKVVGEPNPTHWQLSKTHDKDGVLSAGTPWSVSYIVRDKPDDGDTIVDLRLVPSYLTSYDAIIPLIQKQSEDMVEIVHYELLRLLATHYLILLATPAQLCEALLRATGKWKK